MGRTNRYVVAYTPHTLILADMEVDKVQFIQNYKRIKQTNLNCSVRR